MALCPASTLRGIIKGSRNESLGYRRGGAMTVCRVLPLVALIVAIPHEAGAQPGGVPGEGRVGAPPTGMPPACQQLLAMRDEVQKHGQAIQKANERKASVQ